MRLGYCINGDDFINANVMTNLLVFSLHILTVFFIIHFSTNLKSSK